MLINCFSNFISQMDLSESSATNRSGSTLTGYEFDTVKHLNFESSSASRLSLSLKSEGYEDFTLTPDEPRIIPNCEIEDFSLTPEASCSEAHIDAATRDDTCSELNLYETHRADSMLKPSIGDLSESISNNDVLEIVDKFLTNERLLQENLNIIPMTRPMASPFLSPIDSDASLTNLLIQAKKGTLFNLHSSSSKSTLDGTMDLEKFHFDDTFMTDTNHMNPMAASNSTTTTTVENIPTNNDGCLAEPTVAHSTDHTLNQSKCVEIVAAVDEPRIVSANDVVARIPSRYSMQKLEPYQFADEESDKKKKKETKLCKTQKTDTTETTNYCSVVVQPKEKEPTFGKRSIFSILKRKKSQSLESVEKQSTCYPL